MLAASTSARNITIASIWFFAARSARPAMSTGGATPSRLPNATMTPPGAHTLAQNALATSTITNVRIPHQTSACTVVIMALPSPAQVHEAAELYADSGGAERAARGFQEKLRTSARPANSPPIDNATDRTT